ncbi:DUF6507 family protein [Streptomyces aurantiacus]|nr:DUF6507 family protein [Streptomyces aurantiacus]
MTAWDIEPGGVRGVLQRAGTAAETMASAGKQMQKTLPQAAKHAGTIVEGGHEGQGTPGPVGSALGVFFNQWSKNLTYIAERAGSSLNGAHRATEEYIKGDLDMAAKKQGNALAEMTVPDMPGVGGGGGAGGGARGGGK